MQLIRGSIRLLLSTRCSYSYFRAIRLICPRPQDSFLPIPSPPLGFDDVNWLRVHPDRRCSADVPHETNQEALTSAPIPSVGISGERPLTTNPPFMLVCQSRHFNQWRIRQLDRLMGDEYPLPDTKLTGADRVLRRKVRKGTVSCWECKRRKIKCTFTALADNTPCNGCRRRGTQCVGQEFPQRTTEHVGDRLGRVEALLDQMVKNSAGSCSFTFGEQDRALHRAAGRDQERCSVPAILPKLPLPLTGGDIAPGQQLDKDEQIRKGLIAAWPGEHVLNCILNVPVDFVTCFHGSICIPISGMNHVPSPREMLRLPPPGSHPVLIARKLLTLASYLLAILPSGIQSLLHQGIDHQDIASSLVETARTMVNCNDELVDSIQGIECIMMESMYHNNTGNLRRAWLTTRRAMLVAQLMGLHEVQAQASAVKTLDSQICVQPGRVWHDIVTSDRYLSLILGLPQGSPGADFTETPSLLDSCTPEERLKRIHSAVGGRIIQREESDVDNVAVTQELDTLLQKASMSMNPQWWLIPDMPLGTGGQLQDFHNTERLMSQFTHYHLVARLHLPYLLRTSPGGKYEYNKISAVNASREVLSRFVALRDSHPIGSYCRGIDFLAFIASVTLCIAHIDSSRQSRLPGLTQESAFFASSLVHQRASDRGIMERALTNIERMTTSGNDPIASRIATILRHLLVIEADASAGSSYTTKSRSSHTDDREYGGELRSGGSMLRIHIPRIGSITIKKAGISVLGQTDEPYEVEDSHVGQERGALGEYEPPQLEDRPYLPASYSAETVVGGLDVGSGDWVLQGVDTALFDSLIRGSDLEDIAN